MPAHAKTVVIWNPSAGSASAAAVVHEQLQTHANVETRTSDSRDHAIELTVEAAREGAEVVVAAGGDGSVSSVVEGLMQCERRPDLGILPLGTGNDLARTLEIPLNPIEALETLSTGQTTGLDAVQISTSQETRWYANMLTGGNTGRYLAHLTDEIKHRWGPFCYLRGMIDIAQDLQVYQVEVICDEKPPERFEALNLFVANGRNSGGGLAVSPEAELDDGCVDIVIIQDGDAGDIAALTSQYFVADYLENELVHFRRARRVTIHADPTMPLTADGDEVGETTLSATTRRRCLRVIVPASVGS